MQSVREGRSKDSSRRMRRERSSRRKQSKRMGPPPSIWSGILSLSYIDERKMQDIYNVGEGARYTM